jgi:predicted nicotinamide N-methyase
MTTSRERRECRLLAMAGGPIDLVDEEIDLGGGRRVRIARPRAPDALLERAVSEGASDAPYWAELWPSARALAANLASRDLRGVRAVELGCGLALPGVVAALAGAEVLAVDHDADSVEIAIRNGAQADGRLHGLVADLRGPVPALDAAGPFDRVLAADVLYDSPLADALMCVIPLLTAPGGRALVAFPWRGQADALAAALERAGMRVELARIDAPGVLPVRTVGLLDAFRPANPQSDSMRMSRDVE